MVNEVDLYDFDFNVNYDDSVLSFTNYSLGTGLDDSLAPPTDYSRNLGGGVFNLAQSAGFLADLSAQLDTFTLATLSFSGISEGISLLSFDNGEAGFILLGDGQGDSIDASFENGSIDVYGYFLVGP